MIFEKKRKGPIASTVLDLPAPGILTRVSVYVKKGTLVVQIDHFTILCLLSGPMVRRIIN